MWNMIEKILEVKKSIYRISKPSRLPFDTFQTIKKHSNII